jgi:hypothetical protein
LSTKAPQIYVGAQTVSSTNVTGKTISTRRLILELCLSTCTKINSKWIKDLHLRPETFKLLQERIENTLLYIGISNNFLNKTPLSLEIKARLTNGII